jgi:uncharacterized membrane protein SpoIIM required for sporulation/ABC-type transport system involved in multi-copper enzyme maturation permease subunit
LSNNAIAGLQKALIITRREVRDQFRDWRIIFPVITLTVIFPALMNFTARQAVVFVEQYGAPVVAERLIPFLLMVVGFFPISVSLVIALESFVGEKERRSIEPLLSSPLSDSQLYLGKLLAAIVPTLIASYLGIVVYLVGVYNQIGWKPAPVLILQIVLLTTVQAVVMVSGAVVVSSQTTSVRAANLLASFIIIPMAFLIQGESIVMFWAIYPVLWWAVIGQVVIAIMLVRTGLAYFNREELLGRELDVLDVRGSWKVFKGAFIGQARSPIDWYRLEVPQALRELKSAYFFSGAALAMGIWAGINQASVFSLPAGAVSFEQLRYGFAQGLKQFHFISAAGALAVWLNNVRVIAIASLLGVFSFGVLGLLVLMLPLTFISYIAANVAFAGGSVIEFLTALVLPHGILEIPAILLTGAAILNLGATLTTPGRGKTIAESLMAALARWAKIVLGVVIPLFIAAALVEVFITPRIALSILGH